MEAGQEYQFEPLEFERRPADAMLQRSRELLQELTRRRSVREFSSEPVPREVIENAIRAAGRAPSGANLQPWHFVVVTDPEVKRQIREAAEEEERKSYEERFPDEWREVLEPLGTDWRKPHLENAPALIVAFAERFRYGEDGEKKKNYYVMESVGIACGFLIVALHHAGLATLTHTPNPMRFLREILRRPDNEMPVIVFPVGYPAEDCQVPVIGKKPLEEISTWI